MRSASEAVAEAYRWTTNRDDMCLYTVQCWLGAPWSGPYASDAWRRWGGHHPGDTNPPAGVPVYWDSPRSKYGHVALSVGGGRCRSTDFPRDTRVGDVGIAELTRRWDLRYLGWADRFSGGPIAGIGGSTGPTTGPTAPPTIPTPTEDDIVAVLARRPDTGAVFLIGPAGAVALHNQSDVDALVLAGFTLRSLAAHQIDAVAHLMVAAGKGVTDDQAKKLQEVWEVLFHGGPGTPHDLTVYQRLARVEQAVAT